MGFDINSVLLLLRRGDSSLSQTLLFLLLPFIGQILGSIFDYLKSINIRQWNKVSFDTTVGVRYGRINGDYSKAYRAICHHVSKIENCQALKEAKTYTEAGKTSYVLDECRDVDIGGGIYISLYNTVTSHVTTSPLAAGEEPSKTFTLQVKSKYLSVGELTAFVKKLVEEHDAYMTKENKGKLYHFIFKSKTDANILFSQTMISDTNDETNMNFETFDHIFNEHKDTIIADMDRLNDVDYYRRNGLKRKKGYLFYGNSGCGKTYTVMAMANKGNRHIIEIPFSRITSNTDLEEILNLTSIRGIDFKKDEVIILFDEIDCGYTAKRENFEKTVKPVEVETDPKAKPKVEREDISLGTILSRLDGIGSYNGVLFVATTNCITSLDPALYRHGRLDPYHFTHSRREDIVAMIENAFGVILTEEQLCYIPTRSNEISPSTLKKYIQDFENDCEGLLQKLKKIGDSCPSQ